MAAMASTLPPIHINQKAVKSNLFSKHDNRHAFQNSGVYFGQGLGKRLTRDRRNQHQSENHISWSSRGSAPPRPTCSTYRVGYCATPPAPGRTAALDSTLKADENLLRKFQCSTKPSFRRFPRSHPFPKDPKDTSPSTNTTCRFGIREDGSHVTPLSVLAATQQPFLQHNPWTYSNKL